MKPDSLPAPPNLQIAAIGLFLDVDGTLVEIEREPGAVHVPARMRTILSQLNAAADGALALVSGRSVAQIDQLFAPLQLNAAGLHGLERRNLHSGVVRAKPDESAFDRPRAELGHFAESHEGVLLEDKGLTLALHYRNAPQVHDEARQLVSEVVASSDGALVLLEGKMVLEIKPPGADKGHAITAFMNEPPFRGRLPVFAGDDVTDEAGFAAINRLGGVSIRIGPNNQATAARYGLGDVSSVQDWLSGLLGAKAA